MRTMIACCLSLVLACPAYADLAAARAAFDKKDFATALKEVQPLADKNEANASLMLGLMFADGKGVKRNKDEAIRLITAAIQGKADLSLRLPESHNALTWAIDTNKPELIEQLLQAGADINLPGYDDRSPLMTAVKEGRVELVQKLLERGARLDQTDREGNLPLHMAAGIYTFEKAKTIIDLLLPKCNINAVNKEGESALLEALDNGKKDIALYLVEKGADINLADTEGEAPIFCVMDDFEPAEALELLKVLAPKGLKFEAINKYGKTVLHELARSATHQEALEKLKALDEVGAVSKLVNAADSDGLTALMFAAQERSDDGSPVPMVTLLLEKGADLKAISKRGNAVLHLAIDPRTPEVSLQLLDLLLARGIDVNQPGEKKMTALHMLAEAAERPGATVIAKRLLEKGANPNLLDENGRTPLHIAADNRDKPELGLFAQALLDGKADPNLLDQEKRAPLHIAAREGGKDFVRVLLSKGADPKLADKYRDTPEKIAEENGNKEIYAMIRDQVNPAPAAAPAGSGPLSKADQEKRATELYEYLAKISRNDIATIEKTMWEIVDRCPETTQAPDALWKLSNLYLTGKDQPDYDNAQKALEKLAATYPQFQPSLPLESALPHVQKRLGFIYEKKENWDKVIALYEPLFMDAGKLSNGEYVGYGLTLGGIYEKKGMKDK
ncbi:MAG TPA: ankyrin repeat domain-containing protein, partial [Candidatus Ozemobacteraceae bacterium]|nr:ankyrin repeat domain-containing protein [Candidatus Ozemobacteraceae bacterium]